ncbi:MAG TPA: noncanonical pyrimidine nucleotidase, YjjG family [Bacteroidales bacterium]|nr:noncanonical pyrimidine nucleotidase, YjjG family [Bacteroidales bacterium]
MIQPHRAYKAVFLDWDNTIGDFSHAAEKALKQIYEEQHLNRFFPSFETYYTIYHEYNLYLWDLYGENRISKEELQLERFCYPLRQMTPQSKEYLLTDNALIELARTIGDEFCRLTTEYFTLMPYAAEVIPYLAARYPLTIISNGFVEVQYQKIDRSGLRPYFRHIILSEEVGIQKPQPEIYEKALTLNAIQACEAVMIGDSFSSDIVGAKTAGIDQIWVKSENTPLLPNQSATWIVKDLSGVKELL